MAEYKLFVPESVKKILEELDNKGIEGYLVGGCVRDSIMNKPVHDYDIAVCAPPDEILSVFKNYRCIETGKRYGTITVLSDGKPIEITSARKDGTYSDGRRPDSVEYTLDIREDLARRDFTINALAYSSKYGLIDEFNGVKDINDGIIRAVGNPIMRFEEDGLRIMRALRFSSVLGYKIEPNTSLAMKTVNKTGRLQSVSSERIYSELCKMLCGDDIARILLEYSDIICEIIPELKPCIGFEQRNPHHIFDVYSHIAYSVGASYSDKIVRLTMLLHDIAKPLVMKEDENGVRHFKQHEILGSEISRDVLYRLKADNSTIEEVATLIKYHDLRPNGERKAVRRYIAEVGFETAKKLLYIRRADLLAQNPNYISNMSIIDDSEKMINILIDENACLKVSDLAISGKDLLELGFKPGPKVGEMLSKILTMVVEEEICNNKSELIEAVVKLKNS